MSDYIPKDPLGPNDPRGYDRYGNSRFEAADDTGKGPYILLGLLVAIGLIGGLLYFNGSPKDGDQVAQICEDATRSPLDRVDVANHNLDTQTVISGDVTALERAMERARELQARVIRLRVKVSSHTPLHIEQAHEFALHINEIPLADPRRPVVSNISSRALGTAEELRQEFRDQLPKTMVGKLSKKELVAEEMQKAPPKPS